MQTEFSFEAKVRTGKGKSFALSLRRQGLVPAVVYGQGGESLNLVVPDKEIGLLIGKTVGKNALVTAKITDANGAVSEKVVMFKEAQRDPVKNKLVHVDFYNVDFAKEIKLRIPVKLEGVPVGVKESGGILEHGVRSLRVRCLPNAIPQAVTVDVSALALEQNVLLQDIAKMPGVTFTDNPHTVLAHVATVEEEVVAAPAEGAAAVQPEVIGEKEREAARAAKDGDKPAAGGKDAKAAPAKAAPAAKPAGKK